MKKLAFADGSAIHALHCVIPFIIGADNVVTAAPICFFRKCTVRLVLLMINFIHH